MIKLMLVPLGKIHQFDLPHFLASCALRPFALAKRSGRQQKSTSYSIVVHEILVWHFLLSSDTAACPGSFDVFWEEQPTDMTGLLYGFFAAE